MAGDVLPEPRVSSWIRGLLFRRYEREHLLDECLKSPVALRSSMRARSPNQVWRRQPLARIAVAVFNAGQEADPIRDPERLILLVLRKPKVSCENPGIRPGKVVKGVGNVFGVVDVFPSGRVPVFVRAGAGFAEYYTSNPFDPDSRGWSWTAGAGYVIPIIDVWGLRLVPMVDYAAGRLGDVDNLTTPQIGQRYSVVEFKAAFVGCLYRCRH
jgi:hypothetical protein